MNDPSNCIVNAIPASFAPALLYLYQLLYNLEAESKQDYHQQQPL